MGNESDEEPEKRWESPGGGGTYSCDDARLKGDAAEQEKGKSWRNRAWDDDAGRSDDEYRDPEAGWESVELARELEVEHLFRRGENGIGLLREAI